MKFQEWLKSVEPETVLVEGDALKSLADKVGVKVEKKKDGKYYLTRNGVELVELDNGPVLKIFFSSLVREEKGDVKITPYLWSRYINGLDFAEIIIKTVELEAVVVPFPEKVVRLPVPKWVTVVAQDPWDAAPIGELEFVSKVEARWNEFLKEFYNLFEGEVEERCGSCGAQLSDSRNRWWVQKH